MSTEGPIRQHFVPQCYLRRFTNSKKYLHVFDKADGRMFPAAVANVANERCFYDSEMIGKITGDRKFIERKLCDLEGNFSLLTDGLLGSLASGQFRSIRKDQRLFLSLYMTVQKLRTPEHLRQIESGILVTREGLRGIHPEADKMTGEEVSELAKQFHHQKLTDKKLLEEYSGILNRHIWTIEEALPGQSFLTSDQPFVMHSHIGTKLRPRRGIAAPGIQIFFPLSPKFCLVLYERTHFIEAEPLDGRRILHIDPQNMEWANHLQIAYSNRFIYSRTDDFDLAKDMMAKNADAISPNRPRISANAFGRRLDR